MKRGIKMNEQSTAVPEPVDGKFVFQASPNMRIRFNADGWVEEIGKGTPDDSETILNGVPGTKLDDLFASRYYDLYARVILFDIHPTKGSGDLSRAYGTVLFRDLDPSSPLYTRVNMAIKIGNHYFGMNIKELG